MGVTQQFFSALGFDYGLTHIGVAYGQSLTLTARPLEVLSAREGVPSWGLIEQLIDTWRPCFLVVGLPLNMDETESELSRRARKFSRRLEGRFRLPVALMDERLSSFEVKQQAFSRGHQGDFKKKPIDALAAQLILEDWLKSRAA